MGYPTELKYTKDHEWVSFKDGVATIGITDYALGQLGDVVFIELPEPDDAIDKDSAIGTIESTKTVSDILSPVSGTVTETNDDIAENQEKLAEDPYGRGWLVKIKTGDSIDHLMSAAEYEKYTAEH